MNRKNTLSGIFVISIFVLTGFVFGQVTPTVTWPTASPITYGQDMSDVNLTGGSAEYEGTEVTGTFLFGSPFDDPNYEPDAGTYNAPINFIPDDQTTYETVSSTVELLVEKATATVTLSDLVQTYDAGAKEVTVTTVPGDLTVDLTYDGSATAPTDAGTYAVVATVNDTNYEGTATADLEIQKATATVTLSDLVQTYDEDPKPVTVTTVPADLTVDLTYDGSATAPTDAGTYAVVATVNDTNYEGEATADLEIQKATATVTLSDLVQTYDAGAKEVTVTTVPSGLTVDVTYDGSATAPTDAGTYAVVATVNDTNYEGEATADLEIQKATATVTLSDLVQTYDAGAKEVTVTTVPSGLTVDLTYDGSATAPTDAGTYAVVATVNDTNYEGEATADLEIQKATATVTLSDLVQTYDAGAKEVTVTTVPGDLTVDVTYDGSATAPTNAGTYEVFVEVDDTNYEGTASDNLVIQKATATVTLSDLVQTYDEDPKPVTVTTVPSGLTVDVTYDGSATVPTDAGTYAVVATVNDTNYEGEATADLEIQKATATVTLSDLVQTYDGTEKPVTVTTNPAGLAITITYDGEEIIPTDAGTYLVEATVIDDNYEGEASDNLVIQKATATVTLSDLVQIYDGDEKPVTVTTIPEGLAVSITYDGSTTIPTNAGTYAVVVEVDDTNYEGTATADLEIQKATATVTLSDLVQTYDAGAKEVTVTTVPGDLTVDLTYDGSATAPTDAGTYAVVATVNDTNYEGTATADLEIQKATATVTLSDLVQTYDEDPKPVTVTTVPADLTVDLTYDGSATAPTDAGTYAVVATVNDTNYEGEATADLEIQKATATVTLSDLVQTYDAGAKEVTVTTVPSGLTVDVTYDGSATAPTDAGTYAVVATVNDTNYEGEATADLEIQKATATVTLSDLVQTYDAGAKEVTVTTVPSGLTVDLTYDGSATAPTDAGTYAVVATVNDTNYEGEATADLEIQKATATVTLSDLVQTYDAGAKEVTVTTVPGDLTVDLTYDGSATAPTDAGTYAVVATVNDTNYEGTATADLEIQKATATVTLSDLVQTYDEDPKPVTVTTVPADLTVDLTYDGSATAPTDAGTYAVVATVNDTNYEGEATADLEIQKATATVTLSDLVQTYDAGAKEVTVTTVPSGLTVDVTYDGSATAPTDAGTYAVVATVNDTNYEGEATADLEIQKATATVTLSDLVQTYDAGAKEVTVTTVPSGLTVDLTYDGSATAPTDAGTYAVVATVNDTNYEGEATADLEIQKATATVTLSDLVQTYDEDPKPVTVTTDPEGLAVVVTYDGSTIIPTNAGTYVVVVEVDDTNYEGEATGELEILKATAIVTLSDLLQTYDGTEKPVTVTTDPDGLTLVITYDGEETIPTDAGTYLVEATVIDDNYEGEASDNLVILKATATVTLSDLLQTYDGTEKPVTVTTNPAGLAITITYDGEETIPTDAGTYLVEATVIDANYEGTASDDLVIQKATATVTLSDLVQTYDGTEKPVTVTTNPAGLAITITYDGEEIIPTDAGTYLVEATVIDNNYEGEANGTLQINPLTINVTADALSKTYGEADPELTYDFSPDLIGDDTFDGDLEREAGEDVDTYPINQGTLALGDNYTLEFTGADFTINAADLTITANTITKTVGVEYVFTGTEFTTTTLVAGDEVTSVTLTSAGAAASADVGSYPITIEVSSETGVGLANYNIDYVAGTMDVVDKITLSLPDLTAENKVYDGTTDAAILDFGDLSGVLGDDDVSIDISLATASFDNKNVGTEKTITVSNIQLIGADAEKYTISDQTAQADITVRDLILSDFTANTKVYDGTTAVTGDSFNDDRIDGDDLAFTWDVAFEDANAGDDKVVSYTNITISDGADQGNYTLASTMGTAIADIIPATLSITAVDASKVYGEEDGIFTVDYDGFVGEEDETVLGGTLAFTRESGENVGEYAITPSGLTSSNYDIEFIDGILEITPLGITITADALSKTYGEADPELTYDYSPDLIGDDTFTGALTRAVGEDVGTYAIVQGALALSTNYTLSFTGADFTITPLTINVTADALSKTYGETDPELTYDYSPDLIGDDTFTGALTRAVGENVGTYAIDQGTLELGDNYTLSFTGADFTINAADLTITANTITKTVGVEYVFTGTEFTTTTLVAGDEVTSVTLTSAGAAASADVGSYPITIEVSSETGVGLTNYNIGYEAGTMEVVDKITLSLPDITAENKVYDGTTDATILDYGTLDGVVGDDDVSIDVSLATASFNDKNVGTGKTVTVTNIQLIGDDAEKYTISDQTTQANITARTLTLSNFSADSKVYDGTTAVTGDGFNDDRIDGDELTFSYDVAFEDANVGEEKAVSYTNITISGGADQLNYTLAATVGTATADITPALLTITANTITKTVGVEYVFLGTEFFTTGLVTGDEVTSVTLTSAGAAASADVGSYPIIIEVSSETGVGLSNYNIGYEAGTMDVVDKITLSLPDITAENKVYDGTTDATILDYGTLDGVVGDDDVSIDVSLATASFNDKNVGTGKTVTVTNIQLIGDDAEKYTISDQTTQANITARTLTLSNFTADSKVYDGTTDVTGDGFDDDRIEGDDLEFTYDVAFADANVGDR
jgi:hypothetical protein